MIALFTEIGVKASETPEEAYGRWLRGPVRGLWGGAIDRAQFEEAYRTAVEEGHYRAWYEGAAECGIRPDELSVDEHIALLELIDFELQWIPGLADFVIQKSKANGGKLTTCVNRLLPWANRYAGVRAKAKTMACADRKLEWVLGPREESCPSCMALSGKVKRGSYWHERGILPGVHGAAYLECRGYNCGCDLVPTDKPMSKGPLPGWKLV